MPDEAPVFEPLALPGDSVTEPPAFEPIGDAGLPPLNEDTPSSDLPDLPAFPDADMKQDSIAEGLPPLSTDGLSESGIFLLYRLIRIYRVKISLRCQVPAIFPSAGRWSTSIAWSG